MNMMTLKVSIFNKMKTCGKNQTLQQEKSNIQQPRWFAVSKTYSQRKRRSEEGNWNKQYGGIG